MRLYFICKTPKADAFGVFLFCLEKSPFFQTTVISRKDDCMNKLLKNSTFQIFLAMILGMVAGAIVPNIMVSTKFVGDIFLRLIQMSVVVLVMGSVIEAVGSLKRKEIGALGGKAFIVFACTTLVAGTVGIIGANLVKPGSGIDWFSGMFRTTLNVIDDVLVALVVAKQEGEFDRQIFDRD